MSQNEGFRFHQKPYFGGWATAAALGFGPWAHLGLGRQEEQWKGWEEQWMGPEEQWKGREEQWQGREEQWKGHVRVCQ